MGSKLETDWDPSDQIVGVPRRHAIQKDLMLMPKRRLHFVLLQLVFAQSFRPAGLLRSLYPHCGWQEGLRGRCGCCGPVGPLLFKDLPLAVQDSLGLCAGSFGPPTAAKRAEG